MLINVSTFIGDPNAARFSAYGSFSLTAPVLAWTTAASDNTPGFSVSGASLDLAPVGAQIEIQVSTDVGFTPPPADTELAAVSGNPVAIDVSPALSDGQYWARARLLDSLNVALTDWSNVVTNTIDATAPTITSANSANQAENTAFSLTLTANESVTWTKTGGADSALFVLAGSNLSMTAKDYEIPTDADTNNTYVVQITATDAAGNATNQTITVTVTDDVADNARQFVMFSPIYGGMFMNSSGTRQSPVGGTFFNEGNV